MVKIFIGNIADGARNNELQSMFEKYGTVSECSILTNFGFVHMDSESDAFSAVKGLDNAFFAGSTIKVEMSHGKPSRGGRGGDRGGRDRGGGRGRGGRGRGGGFRDRDSRRDRYDDYPPRSRDYYDRPDPYSRDPYSRDPYPRDPYARDPYVRDPYERRPPPRDMYERRPPPRDPYHSLRDPYAAPRDPYAARSSDPYARDRSPIPRPRSYEAAGGYELGGGRL